MICLGVDASRGKPLLFVVAGLLVAFASGPARAQDEVVGKRTPIGTNLAGVGSIVTQWDFVDLMKGSNVWVYNNGPNQGNPTPLDSLGNPVLLPGEEANTLPRLKIVDSSQNRVPDYPAGQYTITWEGNGQFFLTGDGDFQLISLGELGPRTFTAATGQDTLYLEIDASDPGDPLRNIQILMPTYGPGEVNDGQPFHQTFVDRTVKPFGSVRFMDWNRVNGTTHSQWSERTSDGANQYTVGTGVPIEEQLRLTNQANGDAWFTMPTHADDDYVTRFARAVLYGIDPSGDPYTSPQENPFVPPVPADRTIYVEYGNEVWNGFFEGFDYVTQQAIAAGLNPSGLDQDFAKQWAVEARRDFDIWSAEFAAAGQADRLKRVAAIQASNRFISPIFLDEMTVGGVPQFDVISSAFYAGVDTNPYDAATTKDDIIDDLFDTLADNLDPTITTFLPGTEFEVVGPAGDWLLWKQFADDAGVELIAYEGGQHVTAPSIDVPWYDDYVAAQRDSRMYDFYTAMLEGVFDTVEADGMAFFSSVGLISQYGAWGALEYQDQDAADAPKYRALTDFARGLGDLVLDGVYDDQDIDALRAASGMTPTGEFEVFDLNDDGTIDEDDTLVLVEERIGTSLGDANLDGVVDLVDIELLLAGAGGSAGWLDGDFNGDGIVDGVDALLWRQNTSLVGLDFGDYNLDGFVSAADYAVWRDRLSSALDLRADGNADGVVDEADYALWRMNFGTAVGSGAAAATVPEPTAGALAALALLAFSGLRRRGRTSKRTESSALRTPCESLCRLAQGGCLPGHRCQSDWVLQY